MQLNGAAPEEKEKSTRLGVQSIILATIGIVLVITGVVLGSLCAHQVTMAINGSEQYTFPIASFFGAIIFYVIALFGLLRFVLSSIKFATFQRKLNKKTIGKVSLALSLIALIVSIVGTIVIIVLMV